MVQETLLYVISLLFAVMLLVILGQKLRIAYPVFLVIGELLISLIPGAHQFCGNTDNPGVLQGLTLPWLIKKLKLDEDKPEIPAEIQSQQIHRMLMKLSIERLEEKHAELLRTNTLVRNLKQRLTDDIDYTRLNIESLKDNKDEKQQVSEFNSVLMDLGEFLNKQLSSLPLQKLFVEEAIPLEEGRIVLEQNKIG